MANGNSKRIASALYRGKSVSERFWLNVIMPTDRAACWEWCGSKTKKGYSYMTAPREEGAKQLPAHRVSYELNVGPIPHGLVIDHLCRNRGCVNPAHLEPVTGLENVRRGDAPPVKRGRSASCPNGHLYTPDNTQRRGGVRRCLACAEAFKSRYVRVYTREELDRRALRAREARALKAS